LMFRLKGYFSLKLEVLPEFRPGSLCWMVLCLFRMSTGNV